MPLDTDELSARYRAAAINPGRGEVLITDLRGTEQERDLTEPANCEGLGRIRHFKRKQTNWVKDPLPIDPVCRSLKIPPTDELRVQVFQNAVCNWRCWYCYVPFTSLSANTKQSRWVTAEQLVALYQAQEDRPHVIDLSGGQPDLTPEWVPWMMKALQHARLAEETYVWADDNLSNDYFWRYLTQADIAVIKEYPHFGRVACFKGYDDESFAFNTAAAPQFFDQQFALFARSLTLGIDLYAYATFTTPTTTDLDNRMTRFVDRLQRLHHYLPLRTVPLRIQAFTPVKPRINPTRTAALEHQHEVLDAWKATLEDRFSTSERETPITMLPR